MWRAGPSRIARAFCTGPSWPARCRRGQHVAGAVRPAGRGRPTRVAILAGAHSPSASRAAPR
eukprot:7143932-Lingulodinium_polyedra.AAC.1